jgi:hypothetical protein
MTQPIRQQHLRRGKPSNRAQQFIEESLRDGRGAMSSGPHLSNILNRHKRLAALIDPLGLGGFNPRLLPLPTMTDHTTGGWPTDHPSVREAVTHPILKTADPLAPRLL